MSKVGEILWSKRKSKTFVSREVKKEKVRKVINVIQPFAICHLPFDWI